MTTIYHYSPTNGVFLAIGDAHPSPMEPGVFLIPAHATELEPPKPGDRQQAVFAEGAWSIWADRRGERYYNASGAVLIIEELGQLPEPDWSTEPPAPAPPTAEQELAQLDQVMPAWAEALVALTVPKKVGLPPEIATILDRKAVLRQLIKP